MNGIQLQQKHSCFKWENLLLKHINMLLFFSETFQLDFNAFYFSKSMFFFIKDKMILYLCHFHVFGSFYYPLNDIYKTFLFTVNSSIQMK